MKDFLLTRRVNLRIIVLGKGDGHCKLNSADNFSSSYGVMCQVSTARTRKTQAIGYIMELP